MDAVWQAPNGTQASLLKAQPVARVGQNWPSVDVICVHNDPLLALLIGKRTGQRLVLHMHNDHLANKLLRPIAALALRKVDLVLCVSDYIRAGACSAFPGHASKLRTILNATDPAYFRPHPATPSERLGQRAAPGSSDLSFLYVGRLTEDKGPHVLIEAFALVHAQFPGVRLVIAGSSFFADAPRTVYEQTLAMLAAPLADAIVFTGFVPHDKLRHLYAEADAVVVPSVWQEPFGLVVLEAMASETCVLATRVGGIPEVLTDEVTGLLIEPRDSLALAHAMTRVLLDPTLRQGLATAARQDVLRRFSYQRLATELADTLAHLA
jgi:spore coat protein SA